MLSVPNYYCEKHLMTNYIFFVFINAISASINVEKLKFCADLECDDTDESRVCGLKEEERGVRLKLFRNECDLLKYGCNVTEENAYGIINIEYCQSSDAGTIHSTKNIKTIDEILIKPDANNSCDFNCNHIEANELCAMRQYGVGYRVRLFRNRCEIIKYNCNNIVKFSEIDRYICEETISKRTLNVNYNEHNTTNGKNTDKINTNQLKLNSNRDTKSIVVVNSRMFDENDNMSDTIDNFFAASHVFDLPVKEIPIDTRRHRQIKNLGPLKVFVPWIVIPQNKSSDKYHAPTLSSCYHKCPTKCPDTYAPVCGVPGILAREPSLMFQNHCFMDVAQCKMYWEGKSSTAHSSSYVETSFLFCMGDEMNSVYRFLPAIRTMQRMGRLKKKGKFRVKLRNLRFLNDFRSGHPKFMG